MTTTVAFQLSSPAFADGDTIPDTYACKGRNVSPPLVISGVPAGTDSLALIMHDPDAPHGDFLHWAIWDINTDMDVLPEDTAPDGAVLGMNDFGKLRYSGPCPPSGTHHYLFDLYALDAPLGLNEGAPEEDIRQALADHAIAKTTLTGTLSAS